jgi:hypothetical protein
VKSRTTWCETVGEMQADLDAYLQTYNRNRPHRGRGMEGRTPYKVFKASLPKAKKAAKENPLKEDAAYPTTLRRAPCVSWLPFVFMQRLISGSC